MISIICVYNNKRTLQNYLLKSLSEQKTAFELITIDNTENRFTSAAAALNYGAKQATGDYFLFVHQDVDLCLDSWLSRTEEISDSLPNLGVAGVAGLSENGATLRERCKNTITHGLEAKVWGNPIKEPELVQTVDECLMIIPKPVFDLVQFDEAVCKRWHLYGVDYCLSIRTEGFDVYVIPQSIYHRTGQSAIRHSTFLKSLPDDAYFDTLGRLIKKHKNRYRWIHTSCGSWSTSFPLVLQKAELTLKYAVGSVIVRN